jgi:hypothetical protein
MSSTTSTSLLSELKTRLSACVNIEQASSLLPMFEELCTSANSIRELQQYVDDMKRRIYSEHPSILEVLRQYHSLSDSIENKPLKHELQQKYITLNHEILASVEGKEYLRICNKYDTICAKYREKKGLSNRAGKAKKASDVFNPYVGQSTIACVPVDAHGNAIGTEYDLGRDGSYDGCKVVVLQEYCTGFTGIEFITALQQKGFTVKHYHITSPTLIPTPEELEEELENASQFWLISSNIQMITDKHIEIIIKFWKTGMGLYILGDNYPFYVDANRVLNALSLELYSADTPDAVCPNLQMSGNSPGTQTVSALSDGQTSNRGGFVQDIICTGIKNLYEGVTIAFFNESEIRKTQFKSVLYDHDGKLITIYLPANYGRGSVIADGAFTRLYCSWQNGGTARFVRNCACLLSTILPSEEEISTIPIMDDVPSVDIQTDLDLTSAFEGECTITCENAPIALLCTSLADSDQNTTDVALNNTLAIHHTNMVISGQPVSIDCAKMFEHQGMNPFTRGPVKAILPLVDLSNEYNLKYVTHVANKLFMNGRIMNRYSLTILLAVLEEMLLREPDCPDGIMYMINQLLTHTKSSADMCSTGMSVPLRDGLIGYVNQPKFGNISKLPSYVFRVARIVSQYKDQSEDNIIHLRQMVRHSWIKLIIEHFLTLGKKDNGKGAHVITFLNSILYELSYNLIPIENTGKIVDFQRDFVKSFKDNMSYISFEHLLMDAQRTARILGFSENVFITPNELTMLCLICLRRPQFTWQVTLDLLITQMLLDTNFKQMWQNTIVVTDEMVNKYSNKIFESFYKQEMNHDMIPQFVTPYGPSVYYCLCGIQFGNPSDKITESVIDNLKKNRNEHFQKVFGTKQDGYPSKTSASYPLHRAVQIVLTSETFNTMTERTSEMELSVAKYLLDRSLGNIHIPTLQLEVAYAIESYLVCRRAKIPEPSQKDNCYVRFAEKARAEQLKYITDTSSCSITEESELVRIEQELMRIIKEQKMHEFHEDDTDNGAARLQSK